MEPSIYNKGVQIRYKFEADSPVQKHAKLLKIAAVSNQGENSETDGSVFYLRSRWLLDQMQEKQMSIVPDVQMDIICSLVPDVINTLVIMSHSHMIRLIRFVFYGEGSGTLSIPKCLSENHIVSTCNNFPHPCTMFSCLWPLENGKVSSQMQVSHVFVFSLCSIVISVLDP